MSATTLEFHAFCLTRTGVRLERYAQALAAVVRPGDTVLDLGAGLGVLGFLAIRQGARRVFAVESSEAADIGSRLTASVPGGDRVTFIRGSSFDCDVPEPVDVIVADIHGTFGLQHDGLAATYLARDRWLKPGGRLVPAGLELLVSPVEAPFTYERHVDTWRQCPLGIDLTPVRDVAVHQPHSARLTSEQLLAPFERVDRIDLMSASSPSAGGRARCTVARPGVLHGVGGASRTTLAPGVTFSNAPGSSEWTQYGCAFFPIADPVHVAPGDIIDIDITTLDAREFRWHVTVEHTDGNRREFRHDTLQTLDKLPPSVRKLRQDYRPRLTAAGDMELALLSRFDGSQTVADLMAWLATRIPDGPGAERRRASLLKDAIERCG